MVRRRKTSIITLLLLGILAIVTVRNVSNVNYYVEIMSRQKTIKVTTLASSVFNTTPAKALDTCPSTPTTLSKYKIFVYIYFHE